MGKPVKSCMVVHTWKNNGEIRPAPYYYKFCRVGNMQKYTNCVETVQVLMLMKNHATSNKQNRLLTPHMVGRVVHATKNIWHRYYGTLQRFVIVNTMLLQSFVVSLQYVERKITTPTTENYNAYYAKLQ